MGLVYKYFQIQSDGRVGNTPDILYERGPGKRAAPQDKIAQIYVKDAPCIEYVDFIEKPFLLVSDPFKRAAMLYNGELNCRAVVLTEKKACRQTVYWHIDLPEADCLPQRKNNAVPTNKIVNASKTGGLSFFRYQAPKYLEPFYIVRLDFAESIIRRGLVGFRLTGLEHI